MVIPHFPHLQLMSAGFILVAIRLDRLNTGIFLFAFILLPINQLGDL